MATPITRLVEGLFRGIQLREALAGRQAEDREAQLAERRQAEVERRGRASEARQSLLDLVQRQEKTRSLRDKLEAEGAIRLPEGEVPSIERLIEEGGGEGDFSIDLGPGVAMAASGGRLESVGDDSFLVPPRALAKRGEAEGEWERKMEELRFTGKQQTATALDRLRQEAAVKRELAPVDTIGGLRPDKSGRLAGFERDPRSGTITPRFVEGFKEQTGLTPLQQATQERAARSEARSQRSELRSVESSQRTSRREVAQLREERLKIEQEVSETLRDIKQLNAALKQPGMLGFGNKLSDEDQQKVKAEIRALGVKLGNSQRLLDLNQQQLAEIEQSSRPKLKGAKQAPDPAAEWEAFLEEQ